jgi:anionic cell wall polymer biosynthesis LytR-Cps2A-Psr (LCP) family protein
VTFHLDEPIRDEAAGVDLPAGCTTFDGATALTFVRARKFGQSGDIGDSGGDFGRMARQQRFLREMVRKSTSLETLSQPARVLDLVGALSGAIRTDENLTPMAMARLAYTFRTLGDDGIQSFSIPVVDREWNGAEVLEPADGTDEVLAAFRSSGVPSPPPVAPAGTGTPAPGATAAPGAATPAAPAAASPAPTVDPSPSPTYNNSELSAITC